jgi:hypothetical protein
VATIPTVPTEVPGNFNTSALWNANILGGLNYLFAPVRFKAYSSAAQSFTTGTSAVPITLDTEIVDSDGGHSTVTNTSRYTCQTAGLYFATGSACWATSGTGTRTLQFLLNGAAIQGSAIQAAATSSNNGSVCCTCFVQLAVGDYIELAGWQNSGGTLATSTGTSTSSTACIVRISA